MRFSFYSTVASAALFAVDTALAFQIIDNSEDQIELAQIKSEVAIDAEDSYN